MDNIPYFMLAMSDMKISPTQPVNHTTLDHPLGQSPPATLDKQNYSEHWLQ